MSGFTGEDPEELPVLSDVVDPDAFDRPFRTGGGAGGDGDLYGDLAYGGTDVRLSTDGTVRVESADAPQE